MRLVIQEVPKIIVNEILTEKLVCVAAKLILKVVNEEQKHPRTRSESMDIA